MIRRLGFGLSILFLMALLAGVITFWAVLGNADHPRGTPGDVLLDIPADQLDQEIQLKPPPAFSTENNSDSDVVPCEPEDLGYPSYCYMVYTEATDTMKLASIVEDLSADPASLDPAWLDDAGYDYLRQVWFVDKSERYELHDIATGYCFVHKSAAVSALGSALKDAELLGKTDNCYLALYKEPFSAEDLLKPSH